VTDQKNTAFVLSGGADPDLPLGKLLERAEA
jgi:hypothetical protein